MALNEEFDGVDYGAEVPPDVSKGTYQALCSVKPRLTQGGDPMLALEWRIEDAIDGDKECVGRRCSDIIIFVGKGASSLKMQMVRVKDLCSALNLDPPRYTAKQLDAMRNGDWSAVQSFIDALNGTHAQITTDPKPDKTGVMRDNVRYAKGTSRPTLTPSKPAPKSESAPKKKKKAAA